MFHNMKNNNRGDVSIYVTLMMLMILLVSAMAVGNMALSNLRNTNNIENSSMAFYAADTGNEKALSAYFWSEDGDRKCASSEGKVDLDTSLVNGPKMQYKVTGADHSTDCPDGTAVGGDSPSASLCVYAKGYAGPGEKVVRNVTNSINACAPGFPGF